MNPEESSSCPTCSMALAPGARFCGACGTALASGESSDGREVGGRYRLLSKLGEGGMGAVYRAEQISLKRIVALKVLRPELSQDPGLVRRFNAEAELAAKLSHPNTVTLFDFGQDRDGSLFIAMEFIEGRSLRQTLISDRTMPARRAIPICLQVCDSLDDAHRQGIIHRDLKPDNVMLSRRGNRGDIARVLDFGIAKLRDPQSDVTQLPMTQAGDLVGTPEYMAPEQIRAETVDPRTDVYSLGAMLYEMLTGERPFQAPTVMALLSKHLTETPVPPAIRRPDLGIAPPLSTLVMAMLEKDPARRPPNMDAVSGALAPFAGAGADTTGLERMATRPPGVPVTGQIPALRPPPDLDAPTSAAVSRSSASTSHPADTAAASPSRRGSRAWLWAVAAVAAIGAVGSTILFLAQNEDGDEVAASESIGEPAGTQPGPEEGGEEPTHAGLADPATEASANRGDRPAIDPAAAEAVAELLEGALDDGDVVLDPLPGAGAPSGAAGPSYVDPFFGYQVSLPPGFSGGGTGDGTSAFSSPNQGLPVFVMVMATQWNAGYQPRIIENIVREVITQQGGVVTAQRQRRVAGKRRPTGEFAVPSMNARGAYVVYIGETTAVLAMTSAAAEHYPATSELRRTIFETAIRAR